MWYHIQIGNRGNPWTNLLPLRNGWIWKIYNNMVRGELNISPVGVTIWNTPNNYTYIKYINKIKWIAFLGI